MLLTDGEPYDVDIHDPHYLPADLAHALTDAGRAGIATACLHASMEALRRPCAACSRAGFTCRCTGPTG